MCYSPPWQMQRRIVQALDHRSAPGVRVVLDLPPSVPFLALRNRLASVWQGWHLSRGRYTMISRRTAICGANK